MLQQNSPCFIEVFASGDVRKVVPGKVQGIDHDLVTVTLAEQVDLKPGTPTVVLAEIAGKLHKQPISIVATAETTVQFRRTGDVVGCEKRSTPRISADGQDITLTVGTQPNCRLVDISSEGLGVITHQPLTVGSQVDIDLVVNSIYARGKMTVQAQRKQSDGTYRCGLWAAEKKNTIRKSLHAISNVLYRRHIQRMARAA